MIVTVPLPLSALAVSVTGPHPSRRRVDTFDIAVSRSGFGVFGARFDGPSVTDATLAGRRSRRKLTTPSNLSMRVTTVVAPPLDHNCSWHFPRHA